MARRQDLSLIYKLTPCRVRTAVQCRFLESRDQVQPLVSAKSDSSAFLMAKSKAGSESRSGSYKAPFSKIGAKPAFSYLEPFRVAMIAILLA